MKFSYYIFSIMICLFSSNLVHAKSAGCGAGIKQLDSSRCDTQQISPKGTMTDLAKKAWDDSVNKSKLTSEEILNLVLTNNPFQFRVHTSAHDVMMANQIINNCKAFLAKTKDSKVIDMVNQIMGKQEVILKITSYQNTKGTPQYPSYPDHKILTVDEIAKIRKYFFDKDELLMKTLKGISAEASTAIYGS